MLTIDIVKAKSARERLEKEKKEREERLDHALNSKDNLSNLVITA